MATVFISHKQKNAALAKELRKELEGKGYDVRPGPKHVLAGDGWRESRMKMLAASDAVVALLTAEDPNSNSVSADIGAARAFGLTRSICLLPVLVGHMSPPKVVGDASPIRLRNWDARKIAGAVDKCLRAQFRGGDDACARVFISHRHKHKELVAALVRLLKAAFVVGRADIRSTSSDGHKLEAGENIHGRLCADISRARVVLGVLTPDVKESSYVLFELGAAWGQSLRTFPLLAGGATDKALPEPIRDLHSLDLSDVKDCRQLIEDVHKYSGLTRREGADADVAEAAAHLARHAAGGGVGGGRAGRGTAGKERVARDGRAGKN